MSGVIDEQGQMTHLIYEYEDSLMLLHPTVKEL